MRIAMWVALQCIGMAMRSVLVLVIVVLVAVFGGGVAKPEVVVGVAGPITGQISWFGEQEQRGAELALADLNRSGGVLGKQLRLVTADDFCNPDQAIAAAQKLIADGAILVVGHICSECSLPASKLYEAAGVLQISPASTSPLLTDQGRPNVFRVIGRDDTQGRVAGDYLADHWRGRNIAIFHDGTTYGRGLAEETRRQLNKHGVTERMFAAYTPGKDDYSAEIARLQAANIAVLYIGGRHVEVALMARTLRERSYQVQIVSGDAMATEELGLIAGPAAEGIRFTFSTDPLRKPEARTVVERFRAQGFEPAGYTLLSYAAVQVWAQAVTNAGTLELKHVIAFLHEHQFDTVLGRIGFDAKGDITNEGWSWYVWKDGEYVPLDE
jgi:branched-chain amino acid transport system substrate-binding protein